MPNATNPLAQPTGLPLKGSLGLVASPERLSRNNINLDPLQFSPRVGFGYLLTKNTVLRGGYGIFWLPNDVSWYGTSPNNDPLNNYTTPFTASLDGGLTPANTLSNPFPNGINQPPQRSAAYQSALYGATLPTVLPNSPYAYAQQWNFDVQRQLPGTTLFDFALFKNTRFGPEGKLTLQFRAEFFTLFNHPQFDFPDATLGDNDFGVVSDQVNNPRLIQFALRLMF